MSLVEKDPLSISETRNGFLRRKLSPLAEIGGRLALEVLPGRNPNLLTIAYGFITLVVSASTALKGINNEAGIRASRSEVAALIIAHIFDFIDGPAAREKNRIEPGSHDTKRGGFLDAMTDKFCSAIMGGSRIVGAKQRKDWYGTLVATTATLSTPLTSYFRSVREKEGRIVDESGNGNKDLLGFFGTQSGRPFLVIPATLFPKPSFEVKGRRVTLPVQAVADTISTTANVAVTIRRVRGGKPFALPDPSEDIEKYREAEAKLAKIKDEAIYRSKGLLIACLGSAALAIGAAVISGREKSVFNKIS